jgi:hypothetical protein
MQKSSRVTQDEKNEPQRKACLPSMAALEKSGGAKHIAAECLQNATRG